MTIIELNYTCSISMQNIFAVSDIIVRPDWLLTAENELLKLRPLRQSAAAHLHLKGTHWNGAFCSPPKSGNFNML